MRKFVRELLSHFDSDPAHRTAILTNFSGTTMPMRVNCPACGDRISKDSDSCPGCGLPMTRAAAIEQLRFEATQRELKDLPAEFARYKEELEKNLGKHDSQSTTN